jgi:hypothetical protein
MTLTLVGILLVPGCALLAGVIVWLILRHQSPADGELVGTFAGVLLGCLVLAIGIGKTDTVRLRIDPRYRILKEINANPVFATLQRTSPSNHRALADDLARSLAQNATVAEAFERARPLLTSMTNQELGFASWSATVHWGVLTRDSLAALQSTDPASCVRAMRREPLELATMRRAFNADNARAFQNVVIEVFETGAHSKAHDYSMQKSLVDFNAGVRRFRELGERIATRFGEVTAKEATAKELPAQLTTSASELCAARIALLDDILDEPEPMAGFLVDGLLR